jgi:hypothetical protein
MSARRLAAILTADVIGYSRLAGADEPGTLAPRPDLGGAPVPRGDWRRRATISGEGRGKRRRRPGGGGGNALAALVSPPGLEPGAPRLKVRREDQETRPI